MAITWINITVFCLIIGFGSGLPVRGSGFGLSGFINPFLAPVTKAQQYIRTIGNVFAPVTPSPKITESAVIFPETPDNRNIPFTRVMTTSKSPPTNVFKNNEIIPDKKVEEKMHIDKEILDQIFNDFSDTDRNSINPVDYSTSTEYPTVTDEYETTTDYLLRIPAPVVATLLGK